MGFRGTVPENIYLPTIFVKIVSQNAKTYAKTQKKLKTTTTLARTDASWSAILSDPHTELIWNEINQ